MNKNLCDACETVSHCYSNGCVPITEPYAGHDIISWAAYAITVMLLTLVVGLPLYFWAL